MSDLASALHARFKLIVVGDDATMKIHGTSWYRGSPNSRRRDESGQGAVGHTELDHVVSLHRESLGIARVGHPNRIFSLNRPADALYTRFGRLGDLRDLDEAIDYRQREVRSPRGGDAGHL